MEITEHSLQIFGAQVSQRGQVEFTVREYAKIEQVDERTVRRWIAKGAVQVRRTPSGGIRIVER